MVNRGSLVFLAMLLWGCPDDIGSGLSIAKSKLEAPTDLEGVANGGSEVQLNWIDHAKRETGYRLEIHSAPFGAPLIDGMEFLPANAMSTTFPAFPNSTYYFRVIAVGVAMESDPSNVIVVSTPNVPVRPRDVAVSTGSPNQLSVTWSDVDGESGYRLEKSSDHGASWTAAASAAENATSISVAGLASDTEYLIRVIALNPFGTSTPSLPVSGLTLTDGTSISFASGANRGAFSSVAVEPAGREHLAHYDLDSTNMIYARRTAQGGFENTTVDGGPLATYDVAGDGTTIALDGAGKVHLACHDLTSDAIRYSTNASGKWTITIVQQSSGAKPRLVWDPASDRIHLYYHGLSLGTPSILQAWKPPGQPWVRSAAVPMAVDHAATFSLAIGPGGTRHIALVDATGKLWHFHDSGTPNSGQPLYGFDAVPLPSPISMPDMTSIAAGPGGVHILFHDSLTGSLHHATNASGTWVTETVHQVAGLDLGGYCAAALHPATGRIHAAYYDATNRDLRYARKDPGGAWIRKVVDAPGDVGSHVSIGLNVEGGVHIAYRDETNRRLKLASGAP
jgi:hypothetical protein